VTLLFDTNVWLWWTHGSSERISADLAREIKSLDTQVFVSIASLWELAIKSSLDKISFPVNPGAYVQRQLKRQHFKLLDIDVAHIDAVAVLPRHHRDPFDRMIIAQAKVEALTVVTADRAFADYDIATVLV
jgi:PIN domain nuclease of toxin-antitoxin system